MSHFLLSVASRNNNGNEVKEIMKILNSIGKKRFYNFYVILCMKNRLNINDNMYDTKGTIAISAGVASVSSILIDPNFYPKPVTLER